MKYIVNFTEKLFYEIVVEADTEEEAIAKAKDNPPDYDEAVNSVFCDFEIGE